MQARDSDGIPLRYIENHTAFFLPLLRGTMSAIDSLTGETAIQLRQIDKYYGFRKKKVAVLKKIDLDVPKGSIFGLVGPSGCGKTTLLSCIIGRCRIDNGTIRVFGEHPGSAKCKIPGSGVGYMPQELALMEDLTAKETLEYFGRIFKLNKDKIKERINFLFEFLHLPKDRRLVKNLSGGQQRRVSFAIALLHEPPVLILDEPTVGVDPLLRMNIWKHLVDMSQFSGTTVIITTHYIEEAVLANGVGFMREGRILISGEPQSLLNRYQLSSLEDVFLHLCQNETLMECNFEPISDNENNTQMVNKSVEIKVHTAKCQSISMPNLSKIFALAMKNFVKLRRQWAILLFQFLLPSIIITLSLFALSEQPRNLKIAVVNEDNLLGKKFLSYLDNTTAHQIPVADIDTAEKMVLNGEAMGLIHIVNNFSMPLIDDQSENVTAKTILAGNVHVRLDTTNFMLLYAMKFCLLDAIQKLMGNTEDNHSFDFQNADIPLQFGKPIYGVDSKSAAEFSVPGMITTLIFFSAFALTSMEFTQERKQGLLDRSYAAGFNSVDLLCGHILSNSIVMTIQIGLVVLCITVGFQLPCEGSIILVIFLTLSQGLCGMICGYFVSTLFKNEYLLVVSGLGGLFSSIILSGTVWPLEAMPDFLIKFSHILPQKHASEALRAIFFRGWNIHHVVVWRGYLLSSVWSLIFTILSLISLRLQF